MHDPATPVGALAVHVPKHKRTYDFGYLAPLGLPFGREVAEAFGAFISGFSRKVGAQRYRILATSFRWIIDNGSRFPDLIAGIEMDHRSVDPKLWEDALALWRDHFAESGNQKGTTKGTQIQNFCATWVGLRSVLPEVDLPRPPKNYWKKARAKRSIAEVSGYVERSALKATLDLLQAEERDNPQTQDAVRALLHDLGDVPGSKGELDRGLEEINARRLAQLRKVAERHLLRSYVRFLRCQRMLERNQGRVAEICDAIRPRGYVNPHIRAAQIAPYLTDCTHKEALGNFLTFVDHELGGLIPPKSDPSFTQTYWRYAKPFGGVAKVESYLSADAVTLVAALVIILIDTAWNKTTGIELQVDCLQPSTRSGHMEIFSRKRRSGNEEMIETVPVKIPRIRVSTPTAVRMVQEMTRRAREAADEEIRDRLFVYRPTNGGGDGRAVTSFDVTAQATFDRLQKESKELKLRYTLDMIRPSVLLAKALTAGWLAAQRRAGHEGPDVTGRYVNRYALRAKHERKLRVFQEQFEAVAIQDIQGAAQALGYTVEEFAERINLAHRTGLGVLCRNPKAGVQPGTTEGEICTRQENCFSCPQMFFVATVENVADLILWNEYLQKERAEMQYRHAERWEEKWGPTLLLTEVLLEKMRKRYGDILEDAQEFAHERREMGDVFFPPLL